MIRRLMTIYTLMLFVGLICFALNAWPVAAQYSNEESNSGARPFDEFGPIGGCDLGARLDNFAIQLQNEPTAVGYIICYGPEGEGYGTGRSGLSIMTDYLSNSRGIDMARIKTIYAGHYKEWQEVATQLWIAPHGAAAPEPLRYSPKVEPFTGMYEEFKTWDNPRFYGDAGTGPVFRNSKRAGFAQLLHHQTDTRAVIVAYNIKGVVPGAWRRAANVVAEGLQNEYKVEAGRIEIIYAGYAEEKKVEKEEVEEKGEVLVQLWILPKDAPPPIATVKEAEERPLKATQLGSFSDYALKDKGEARRTFEGFADVLRSDDQLNTCLIVRVKKAGGKIETKGTPVAAVAPSEAAHELSKADLMALIEKWRADLVNDYGISEHRFIVVMAEKDENTYHELETWIVPQGAALPDPNAKDEDIEQAEAMTTDEGTQDEDMQKEF